MALTELKRPTKDEFYSRVRQKTDNLYGTMTIIKRLSEDLAQMDGDTLDAMGVPVGGSDNGLRTDLVNLRTMCDELVAFFEGTGTAQTVVPKSVVNELRQI